MPTTHATLQSIENLTPTILRLSFTPELGGVFPAFAPGQYATIRFPAFPRLKSERSFSISSSAADRLHLEFGIRIGGPYTRQLVQLAPGDRAVIASPFGEFTFDPQRDESAVMFAGGIGVTPFISMIRMATDQGLPNEIILLYSVRSVAEAAYMDELNTLQQRNPNFHVIYIVGDGQVPADHPGFVAGRLTAETIVTAVQRSTFGRSWFLCGPPPYMSAVSKTLRDLGVPTPLIRRERFAVASSAIIEPGSIWPKVTFAAWGVAASVIFATIIRVERDRRLAINAARQAANTIVPTTTTTDDTAVQNTNTESPVLNTTPTTNTTVNDTTTNTSPAVPVTSTPTPTPTQPKTTTPTPTPTYVPIYQPRTTVS